MNKKNSFSLFETIPPRFDKPVKLDASKKVSDIGVPGPTRKLTVERSGRIKYKEIR